MNGSGPEEGGDGDSRNGRDSRTGDADHDSKTVETDHDPTTVVAQGTFDLLHPGHVHYLEEAAAMGDELLVIVARRSNVDHKDAPVLPGHQRREMVDALAVVDRAILGHEADIFVPIEEHRPDVIALGHDQHHDEGDIAAELERRGIDCDVKRAGAREPRDHEEILSTREIVARILERRG